MPHYNNDSFIKPSDENVKIWRYMDFTKFVSLLQKQALYFVWSEKLKTLDPYEGLYTRTNLRSLAESIRTITVGNIPLSEHYRLISVVNCWHMNPDESAAMWNLYAKSGEGIAIQSTYKRVCQSFHATEDAVNIGVVKYINYSADSIPEVNVFSPLLHKRRSYKHEEEIRVISTIPILNEHNLVIEDINDPNKTRLPTLAEKAQLKSIKKFGGIFVRVDLNYLIERVYVAPAAQRWFYELVFCTMKKYEIGKRPKKSQLDWRIR